MSIKSRILFVAPILFLAVFFGRADAQTNALAVKHPLIEELSNYDNPYNIDSELYEIFRRADLMQNSPECLVVADTLRQKARRAGDKKAECLADIVALNYYCSVRALDSVQAAGDRVCEFARENELLQYYYQSFNQQCITFINCGKYQVAKALIEHMRERALEEGFPFGLYSCYLQTAHFFEIQSEFSRAVDYYLLAADFMENNIPDQSTANAYLRAAAACINSFRFGDALTYANKALNESPESSQLVADIYDAVCISLYVLERYDEFNEFFSKFEQTVRTSDTPENTSSYRAFGLNAAINGDNTWAVRLLTQSREGRMRPYLCRLVYERSGDYKDALALSDTTLGVVTTAYKLAVDLKSEEMMAILDTKRLQQENAALELANERAHRIAVVVILLSVLFVIAIASLLTIKKSREHIRQLEKANEVKDKFVKLMSHEVRTPLNVISGFSQVLISEGENVTQEEKEEYGGYINDNVNMLVSLFDGILDTLDLDSGEMIFDFKPASVNLICRSAIKSTENRIPQGVELAYLTELPDDFTITTDSKRTQQILIHLLTNSFQATSEGRIDLRTVVEGDNCLFILTDSGKGIPEDKAEKVFERFYKLDDFQNGSGLGLPVSREIARKLHGSLSLDTSYTSGARFILTLPLN